MKTYLLPILLLTLLSLTPSTSAVCTRRLTPNPRNLPYSCTNSTLEDLQQVPKDADQIDFHESKLPELPSRAFSSFPHLENLTFSNCRINQISPQAFEGLTNLRTLFLYNSEIGKFNPAWFQHLRKLTVLTLQRINLDHIDQETFLMIPQLQSLNLADNDLTCLNGSHLANLRHLTDITVRKNPLTCTCQEALVHWLDEKYGAKLEKDYTCGDCMLDLDNAAPSNYVKATTSNTIFSSSEISTTTSTEQGIFDESRCTRVEWSQLKNLPRTTECLRFEGPNMLQIPASAFFRFSNNLRSLQIVDGNLQEIDPKAFSNLAKLEELVLTGNDLRTVRAEWFKDLANLRRLVLDRNNIEHVEKKAFDLLCNLRTFSIRHNCIKHLENRELFSLEKFPFFDIAGNPLDCGFQDALGRWMAKADLHVEISPGQCPPVGHQEPDLMNWGNWWEETRYADYTSKMRVLETYRFTTWSETSPVCSRRGERRNAASNILSCSEGSLVDFGQIPGGFTTMILSGVQIQVIRNEAFRSFGKTLKVLEIHKCALQEIEPRAFSGLSNLRSLVLEGNRFSTVKAEWFQDLRHLDSLAFVGDSIKSVEGGLLDHLPHLRLLSLQGKDLTCVDDANLPPLKHLRVIPVNENLQDSPCLELLIRSMLKNKVQHEAQLSHNDITYTVKVIETEETSGENTILLGKCVQDDSVTNDTRIHYSCTGGSASILNGLPSDVEWITLTKVNISNLPWNAFARFTNLSRLEFRSCDLHKIHPLAFAGLRSLERLEFYDTSLEIVKESWFKDLDKLRHLYIVRGQLTDIENGVFEKLRNVESFSVKGNSLTCIYTSRLELMEKLKEVDVKDNLWKQNCEKKMEEYFEHCGIKKIAPEESPEPSAYRINSTKTDCDCDLATTQSSMPVVQVLCVFALILFSNKMY